MHGRLVLICDLHTTLQSRFGDGLQVRTKTLHGGAGIDGAEATQKRDFSEYVHYHHNDD